MLPISDADLLIRSATTADAAAIASIYGHWVSRGTSSFELVPPSLFEMRHRLDTLLAGGFPWLVAVRGGEIAGYAYAGPYRPRPAYRFTVEDSIYVAPAATGGGIGRRLLAALLDEATARGFRQMLAVMGDPANSGSARLHESLGFRVVGTFERVGYKHGRWLDTLLMQRDLVPAPEPVATDRPDQTPPSAR